MMDARETDRSEHLRSTTTPSLLLNRRACWNPGAWYTRQFAAVQGHICFPISDALVGESVLLLCLLRLRWSDEWLKGSGEA